MIIIRRSSKKISDGFTLVEALVAITILIIGVLGPMTAATRGITDGLYAQNQLMATYLAQEGVELVVAKVRNNIDKYNPGDPNSWLNDLGTCSDSNIDCNIFDVFGELTTGSFVSCFGVSTNCEMRYNRDTGFYEKHNLASQNQGGLVFARQISLVKTTGVSPPSDEEIKIKVTISWKDKLTDRSLTLVDYLYKRI